MTSADLIRQALRAHTGRLTPGRRVVLEVLLTAPYALSGTELEQRTRAGVDRAALFRTLRLAGAPPAEHVHLKCTVCQRLYCLPHVPVPAVPEAHGLRISRRDGLPPGGCEGRQAGSRGAGSNRPEARGRGRQLIRLSFLFHFHPFQH